VGVASWVGLGWPLASGQAIKNTSHLLGHGIGIVIGIDAAVAAEYYSHATLAAGGVLFATATLPRPWPPFRPTTPQPSSRPWARAAFHYACLCCVFFMFMFSCPALGVFKMHTAH